MSITEEFNIIEAEAKKQLDFINQYSVIKEHDYFKYNNVIDDFAKNSYIKISSETKSGKKYEDARWVKKVMSEDIEFMSPNIMRLMKFQIIVDALGWANASGMAFHTYDTRDVHNIYIKNRRGYDKDDGWVVWNNMINTMTRETVHHEVGHSIHFFLSNLLMKKNENDRYKAAVVIAKKLYDIYNNYKTNEDFRFTSQEQLLEFAKNEISRYAGKSIYEAFAELYAILCRDSSPSRNDDQKEILVKTLKDFNLWADWVVWNNIE